MRRQSQAQTTIETKSHKPTVRLCDEDLYAPASRGGLSDLCGPEMIIANYRETAVKPKRLGLFLERLANLPGEPGKRLANLPMEPGKRLEGFIRLFYDLLPNHGPYSSWQVNLTSDPTTPGTPAPVEGFLPSEGADAAWQMFYDSKEAIKAAWRLADESGRQKKLLVIAGRYMAASGRSGMDGFLCVLLHAIRNAHLLAYCRNRECPEPYFIAQRVGQPYCSPGCAKPAQREAKLRWWNEHGEAQRKERRARKRVGKSPRKRGK